MDRPLKYGLVFYEGPIPFIVPKINATTVRSKLREGVKLISSMQGYTQVYYLETLGLKLTKQNMSTSVFLTEATQMFKSDVRNLIPVEDALPAPLPTKNEVWILRDNEDPNTRTI